MKPGQTAQLFTVCLFSLGLMTGCGGGTSRFDTGPVMDPEEGVNSNDYWASKGFETQNNPAGALPDVPAELGGQGFDEISAGLGFQTNTTYKSMADPRGVPGGMLRIPLAEFPATLRSEGKDANTTFMALVSGMMYESMMSLDNWTDEFIPSLASHWKVEDNPGGGQTFTFRLNPNARWQTGHRFTADDVLATWKLMVDDGLLQPYNGVLYRQYSEPEILSPYLVRTSTKDLNWRHFLYFGASMTIYPAHIIGNITGKEYMERFQNQTMPGSGAYLLRDEDISQGNSLTMTRINNYWDKDNPAGKGGSNFYKVKFRIVQDETLQREMFKKGELDIYVVGQAKYWVKEFLPDQIDQLGKGWIQRKKIFTQSPNGTSGFAFNMREEPFNDIRIRRAFAYLLNREKLIDKLFYNEYLPIHSYYPGSVYENPDNEKIKYDPDTALRLLAEAGYSERNSQGYLTNSRGQLLELDLMIDESPTWERIITVIQEDYKQAGIKLNLKPTTGATQFQMVMDRKFKIHWQNWGGLYFPNPESSFKSDMADVPNTNNLAGFKSQELDSICEVYNKTFEQTERIKLIRRTDKLLMESYQYALGWYGPFTRLGYWNKFGMPEWGLSRTGDWRSLVGLWWYDQEKHRALVKAIKKDEAMPIEEVEIDYWKGYDPATLTR
ncbi:MAG: ABC transporter substrate-binding protein [bacterium]|jgi:microcin C transport system substrate-binding protein|nr:ABC transporter substrate-binding protein [bacterium]